MEIKILPRIIMHLLGIKHVFQIEGVEACIQRCEKRLDDIERSLRLAELSDQER